MAYAVGKRSPGGAIGNVAICSGSSVSTDAVRSTVAEIGEGFASVVDVAVDDDGAGEVIGVDATVSVGVVEAVVVSVVDSGIVVEASPVDVPVSSSRNLPMP